MNKNQLKGRWKKFSAEVKKHWGELTDDEVRQAEGNSEKLMARIQEKYGDSQQAVAAKFNEIMEGFDKNDEDKDKTNE